MVSTPPIQWLYWLDECERLQSTWYKSVNMGTSMSLAIKARQDTSWMEMSLSFNHFLLAREEYWKGTSLFTFVFIHLYAYYHNYRNSYYCHCLTLHNLEVCCVAFLDEYMISGFCFQGPISLFPESQTDLWMGKDNLPYMTRLNGICWLSSGLQWGLMFWGCPGDLGNHSVIFPGDEARCTFSSM